MGTIRIRTNPEYYGSETTDNEASAIATQLASDAREAFSSDAVEICWDSSRPWQDSTDPDAVRYWLEGQAEQIAQDLADEVLSRREPPRDPRRGLHQVSGGGKSARPPPRAVRVRGGEAIQRCTYPGCRVRGPIGGSKLGAGNGMCAAHGGLARGEPRK